MGNIIYCDADNDLLREAIYRFRYEIYIKQMKRRQIHADHDRQKIYEPMDRDGMNFVAIKDGEIIATIRSNRASDESCKYYLKFYRAEEFAPTPLEKIQFTTKFMVRDDVRGSAIGPKLIIYYAKRTFERGFNIDVMDCNKHLVKFFERCGYFSYLGWKFHKEFGTVKPMFASLDAENYADAIGSIIRQSSIQNNEFGGVEHIRRLAQPPTDTALKKHFMMHFT